MKSNQKYLKFGDQEKLEKKHVSRKDAKTRSLVSSEDIFDFAPWRLGGINFPGVALFIFP
jgi:hypothetical protein